MNKHFLTIGGAILIIIVVIAAAMILHMPKAAANTAKQTDIPAVNNAVLQTKDTSALGQYLTDSSGRTLYIFTGDHSGVSNCSGSCLSTWPAYLDSGTTTNLPAGVGTITRSDNGKVQYTYNAMPLYFFASDGPGQATGNGVGGFQLARPVASPVTSTSTSDPTTMPTPVTQPASTPATQTNYSAPTTTPTSSQAGGTSGGW
jgi:predicted lipoprotein with Yx(FWY)xxD motif